MIGCGMNVRLKFPSLFGSDGRSSKASCTPNLIDIPVEWMSAFVSCMCSGIDISSTKSLDILYISSGIMGI